MLLAGLGLKNICLVEQGMNRGASSSFKTPGHAAKVNQANDIDDYIVEQSNAEILASLESGKYNKIDINDIKNELIHLAQEINDKLQALHLPKNADRKTEKATKQRLINVFQHLKKIKNLTN